MAANTDGTFTANGNSEAVNTRGGIISAIAQRTAGSLTVTLQMSLDGTNWATYARSDGTAQTADLDGTTTAAHLLTDPVQRGVQFRLAATSASSASVAYSLARAGQFE